MASVDGTVDLRSDTVTRPTPAMREVMAHAEVGDDVYREDETVNRLEKMTAETLGMAAGLFVPSGTQSNLLALLSHCQRGEEYIAGQQAHTYRYEGGGAAVLGGIQPQPIEFEDDGSLDPGRIEAAIKPDDFHFARTRLLCLENTMAGKVLPLEYLATARELTHRHGLALHLDGARLFNAAVELSVPAARISTQFDSVSVCLSKGLGAPVGSVLCADQELIARARRWRKVLGGGMRQAGILAAAGIFALENHVGRLQQDHANARLLAEGLARHAALGVEPDRVQTNMVFLQVENQLADQLALHLGKQGIRISGRGVIRMVTHLDIDENDVRQVVSEVDRFFSAQPRIGDR